LSQIFEPARTSNMLALASAAVTIPPPPAPPRPPPPLPLDVTLARLSRLNPSGCEPSTVTAWFGPAWSRVVPRRLHARISSSYAGRYGS
jgi:hypothetical protein